MALRIWYRSDTDMIVWRRKVGPVTIPDPDPLLPKNWSEWKVCLSGSWEVVGKWGISLLLAYDAGIQRGRYWTWGCNIAGAL